MGGRPPFPGKRVVLSTMVVAAAAIGVIEWFATPKKFWDKVLLFLLLLAVIALVMITPYVVRIVKYARKAMTAYEQFPEQVRAIRTGTWVAVQTNYLLGGWPIDILRLRQDESFVLFLLDVGSNQDVAQDMQFEIVAPPDMELYGVITAFQVEDEKTWCVLDPTEGNPQFAEQMRERLKNGDLTPPQGYEVRPFMAGAFQYVLGQVEQNAAFAPLPIALPGPEGLNLDQDSLFDEEGDEDGG